VSVAINYNRNASSPVEQFGTSFPSEICQSKFHSFGQAFFGPPYLGHGIKMNMNTMKIHAQQTGGTLLSHILLGCDAQICTRCLFQQTRYKD